MTDKTLQTGSEEHSNYTISPRLLESQLHIRICFSSYSEEHNLQPTATLVIQCIKKQAGATVHQLSDQPSLEGVYTKSGFN
jgi:hypothetical protein